MQNPTKGEHKVDTPEDKFIEQLYQTYYMDVYSYIMTLLKNPSEAEELTQETFFKAMHSEFKGNSTEQTWLCAIAKNLCNDIFRKRKKYSCDESIENLNVCSPMHVENDVLNKCQTIEIHKVLHNLNEPFKEVFSLRVFGELSFKEIGEIFGKSENWARVTYHRSKLKVTEKL